MSMKAFGPQLLERIYREKVVLSLSSVLSFVFCWYLITDVLGLIPALFLPSPEKVFFTIYEKIFIPVGQSTLFGHVGVSLLRILVGTTIALCLAIPLGILMGWYEDLDSVMTPIIEVLRPIPPIAWIPLAILWFGIGLGSKVFIIGIGVFFPTLINTYMGVKFVDPILIKAAQTLGAKDKDVLREVILPASVPLIVAGIRIGIGLGMMCLVAAEMVAASSGLGFLIMLGGDNLKPELSITGMILIGIMGLLADTLILAVEKKVVYWKKESQNG
ncbi:MAG: ABC transporter permease [Syntrophales bacterium]|nr:ABC transporter permease [Syntrophales bacterium]